MRSILVHAYRGDAMSARLETGLSLARMLDGHVTLLVDTPVSRFVAMDPMGGSYLAADALKQALAEDDQQAAAIAEKLGNNDVPFDVVRSEAEPIDALAAAARLADVVVTSRAQHLVGDLAVNLRTPVLVTEDEAALSFPLTSACIAWDGGEQSALAMRSAAPLLKDCGAVHVLTVEGGDAFPATDALRYLSRHGVKAELHEVARVATIEESLAMACARLNGQLLVMGAYGHSRMREFLFGGVTRYFVENCERPALFLAH